MATRPRLTASPRVYEDFQPPSSLLQEKHGETLTVQLPGFTKEQIKVQLNDRSRMIMISGERPIGNNKWRRFRKDLQVPNNCNTTEIQAKFENAVLKITLPLKTEEPQHPIIVPKFAPLAIPLPPPTPPRPHQKPAMDSKLPTSAPQPRPAPKAAPVAPPSPIQKPTIVPNLPLPFPHPPPPPPPSVIKHDAALDPTQTPQPRISEKLNPMSTPYDPLSPKHTTDSKDTLTEKSTQGQEPRIKPKYDHGHGHHKLVPAKITEKMIDLKTSIQEHGVPKIGGPMKHTAHTSENREKTGKEIKEDNEEAKHASGVSAMDWDDESKQHVINIVAAVLLIIALYLHVKYTIKFPDW